jgi:cell pole-organizing protein PopZ
MEEILASIRRIIADDEAKPAAAEKSAAPAAAKPAAPPAKAPVMNDIPPSTIAPPKPAAVKPAPTPPPPAKPAPPAPAAAASNSQDDIDAMLAGLDEATSEAEIRPAQPVPEPEADVFELTDAMAVAEPEPAPSPKPAFQKVEPDDDVEFAESVRTSQRPPAFEQSPFESPPQQMLSRSTVSAVESAFNSLANTVLSNNARTLEDLVKEMLRPMLKSWLDDNLPGLVERIVKAEIERVSRGGR